MKKSPILILLIVNLFLIGCTSKMYTSRSVDINNHSIPTTPVMASLDVDVDKKIGGKAIVRGKGVDVSVVKQKALRDAMDKNDIDVVVDPIFELTIKKRIKEAIVIGYPGIYSDVRTPTKEELIFKAKFDSVIPNSANQYNVDLKIPEQNKKKGLKVLGYTMASSALLGLIVGIAR